MANHKLGRTTEDIKRELTAIMRELKDPRIAGKMLSIVRVEVSRDLSYCKVYISAMEGMDKAREAVKGLTNAAGFIRKEVGARLSLRHVPAMTFCATDSIEYSANISHILSELNIKDGDDDGADEKSDAEFE
ncbi:MAG: 30S ribosome-binding factor RbfA [Clostridia bacterium]|nr:30S ribosome-binding factor RbfA [Clostridia bacterium]